ncbi:hypothetical protein SXIM_51210 [Streptomyces xiamenensis]|uniref:Uncharacterized protein n=1 Tax=Streptomyces xiamenensis TaxID=408015 RepID=A0A0F7G034_9ACTN|nr:hypothetical protein SXIM_51210 [Streptomyces xiamenensis]
MDSPFLTEKSDVLTGDFRRHHLPFPYRGPCRISTGSIESGVRETLGIGLFDSTEGIL